MGPGNNRVHPPGAAGDPLLEPVGENQLFFNNIYAQHSSTGGTSDGDFCFLTSQYPLGYKGSLGAVGLKKLPSVPRVLGANHYATMAFHANQGSLYHRREGFSKLGFSGLYFKEQFQIEDPDRWHTLKDRDFFRQVIEIIAATPEPFFAYIITLSSHSPFDLIGVDDYISSFQSDSPLVQNYFNSMHYVDAALEMLITELQRRYPDTVFMLFGDHTSNLRTTE
ncbi:MAG: LTA synthase family protein, partial [Candidatus Marinimicrobia bacterium]|nr:LTA synthase family protein [Candidatus Neomarinimicrobiota bacterium]